MKKLLALLLTLTAFYAHAAEFPSDWRKWTPVNTALTEVGALPDCKADVSKLPAIFQKTVETYCSIKAGGPGKVAVLVNPGAMKAFEARDGKFPDGNNLILHLKDMKVLFVTSHKAGVPSYAVYVEDGKDVTGSQASLKAETCVSCHTGFQAYCKAGQCGTKK